MVSHAPQVSHKGRNSKAVHHAYGRTRGGMWRGWTAVISVTTRQTHPIPLYNIHNNRFIHDGLQIVFVVPQGRPSAVGPSRMYPPSTLGSRWAHQENYFGRRRKLRIVLDTQHLNNGSMRAYVGNRCTPAGPGDACTDGCKIERDNV